MSQSCEWMMLTDMMLVLGLESQVLVNLIGDCYSAAKDSLRRRIISKNDYFLVCLFVIVNIIL